MARCRHSVEWTTSHRDGGARHRPRFFERLFLNWLAGLACGRWFCAPGRSVAKWHRTAAQAPGDGLQRCCRACRSSFFVTRCDAANRQTARYLDLVSRAMVSSARDISFPTIAAYRMICSAVSATSTHSDADSGLSSPSRRTLRIAFAACSAVALELTFIGRSPSMLRRNPTQRTPRRLSSERPVEVISQIRFLALHGTIEVDARGSETFGQKDIRCCQPFDFPDASLIIRQP
jgi:hypothetical protein